MTEVLNDLHRGLVLGAVSRVKRFYLGGHIPFFKLYLCNSSSVL